MVDDTVTTSIPSPQYVDSDVDVLGNPILKDVIEETIPDGVIDEEMENILPDFIKQLEMGGTKCE